MSHSPNRLPDHEENSDTEDMSVPMLHYLNIGNIHAMEGRLSASNDSYRHARSYVNGDSTEYIKALVSRSILYFGRDLLLYARHDLEECQTLLDQHEGDSLVLLQQTVSEVLIVIAAMMKAREKFWPQLTDSIYSTTEDLF